MTDENKQLPIFASSEAGGPTISSHHFHHPKGGRWLVMTGAGDDDLRVIVLGSGMQKSASDLRADSKRVVAFASEAVQHFREFAEKHGGKTVP